MSNPKPQVLFPYISPGSGGLNQHGSSSMKQTVATDTHYHGIWPGMLVVASTGGYVAVKGTETVTGNSTSFASADYVVQRILDSNGQELPIQYVTVGQLTATGATFTLEVMPVGNLYFYITEDGDTTPITDANNGNAGIKYCNVIISEPTAPPPAELVGNCIGGYFYLNSDTVTGTAGSTSMALYGMADLMQAPYSATAGSQRLFKVQVRSAGQSQLL